MRVLVVWSSKRGGTEGIGRMLADALAQHGFEVVRGSVDQRHRLQVFDAVIVGGALYANRWPANARRFVRRHVRELREMPVWFFSSGPLDRSAEDREVPPPTEVAVLAERVGARGHKTFGGRLAPDARGFPAAAMAKTSAGDWRNPELIRAWGSRLAAEMVEAMPGEAVDHPAGRLSRLLGYGVAGWAACATLMGVLSVVVLPSAAIAIHAVGTPIVFAALARQYFRGRGAREPLQTAATWAALAAVLDVALVAGLVMQSLEMFGSVAGTWLPLILSFLATWATGGIMATLPWPKAEPRKDEGIPEGHRTRA